MPTRFYLTTDTAGTVTVTGVSPAAGSTTASRILSTTQPGAAAYAVAATASNTADSISHTASLSGWGWQALSGTVALNITTGNSLVAVSVALARLNSTGAIQAQGTFSAEQTGTAGVKTFTVTSPSWGTPTNTDRFALIVRVRNTGVSGSQSVTFTVGANQYIDAPVQQGLVTATGQAITTGHGAGTVGVTDATAQFWPTSTLDPLTFPFDLTSYDPYQALTWFTWAGGQLTGPPQTVVVTGQSLTTSAGSPSWPGGVQFAALAMRVPPWVRARATWRARQRFQLQRATEPAASVVTVVPVGNTLALTAGSVTTTSLGPSIQSVFTVPAWRYTPRWWPSQRLQIAPAFFAPQTSATVTLTGAALALSQGTGQPTYGVTRSVTGLALSAGLTSVSIATGNNTVRTVVPTGMAVASTNGTAAIRRSATIVVTGAAIAPAMGTPALPRSSVALPTGAALTVEGGGVTFNQGRLVPVTGLTLSTARGTMGRGALVIPTSTVCATGVGTASGRFPIQTAPVVGVGLTVAEGVPFVLEATPVVVGAASLYGPFAADQWFGGG